MEEPYIFTIYRETKIVGTVLLAVVVIFLVVILLLWAFGSFSFRPQPGPPPPLDHFPELTSDLGASNGSPVNYNNGVNLTTQDVCIKVPGAAWNGQTNTCQCDRNFYGPNCNLPIFAQSYYAVGQGDSGQANIIGKQTVNGISFDPQRNDATTICDNLPGCIGFSMDGKEATFFSQLTVPGNSHIPYDMSLPPKYYMKRTAEPSFPDRVFLAKGEVPLRYWLLDRYENPTTELVSIPRDTVFELDFFPDAPINNAGNLTGLISDNNFRFQDIPALIANTPSDMIKFNGNLLPTLPRNWTLPIYIAFH